MPSSFVGGVSRLSLATLLFGVVLCGLVASGQEPDKPKDADGDRRSRFARLGTGRFRHTGPVFDVAFAPGGETIATAALGSVTLWEFATGKSLWRLEVANRAFDRIAFSPDGKVIYVVGPTADGCELLTLASATGERRSRVVIGNSAFFGFGEFSSNAVRLAVFDRSDTGGSLVILIDPSTGKEHARIPVSDGAAFTSDGKRILLSRLNEVVVQVFDTTTGKQVDTIKPGDPYPYSVRFVHGGDAFTLDGNGALARWPVRATAAAWRGSGHPRRAPALSPDGTLAANVDEYSANVITTEKGKTRCHLRGPYMAGRFSADSRLLALASRSGVVVLVDCSTGRILPQSADFPESVSNLTFAEDGQTLCALAGESWVSWDVGPGAVDPHPIRLAAFTTIAPGGKIGVRPGTFEHRAKPAEFIEADSGVPISRFDPPETGDTVIISNLDSRKGLFSGNGGRFVGLRHSERGSGGQQIELGLAVWEVSTGKRVAVWDKKQKATLAAVSEDGWDVAIILPLDDNVVLPRTGRLAMWEPDTGRLRWSRDLKAGLPILIAFCRGGTRLVVQEGYRPAPCFSIPIPPGPYPLFVLDARTGREICKAIGPDLEDSPFVFSRRVFHAAPMASVIAPDARTAAFSDHNGTILLWDLLADKERCRFTHPGPVHDLAFSPDGRVLAAASMAAPVMLYDVYETRGPQRKPTAKDLDQAWLDLGSPEGAVGFKAIKTYVAAGADGLRALRKQISEAQTPSSAQIEKWIKDLSSENFRTREAATAALMKNLRRAKRQLERTLKEPEMLEVAARVRNLLAAVHRPDHAELCAVRAVEAVEMIASSEALKLLAVWADGSDEFLRREARDAITRRTGNPPP